MLDLSVSIAKHYTALFDWYETTIERAGFTGLIRPVHPEFYFTIDNDMAWQEAEFTRTVMRIDPLPDSNPLPLQKLARNYPNQKIVQLHCWPYQREAGYLAKLHSNVYRHLLAGRLKPRVPAGISWTLAALCAPP